MKLGGLYRCTFRGHSSITNSEKWLGALCLYVGTSIATAHPGNTANPWKVTNHVFIVNGKRKVVDKSMLRHMREIINENR